MSVSLLAFRESVLSFRVAQTSVRYASKKDSKSTADPRLDIIRRALYPSNIRNRASPVGTWRPDVGRRLQRAIPSVQAHETIERAWLLHQRHARRRRQAELERKFQCMHDAMEVLRQVSPRLYAAANKDEDPRARSPEEQAFVKTLKGPERKAFEARIRGLFPREFRTPTDTPPRDGWQYDYTPIYQTP
ncbi:hypothetical protein BKA93DRAFT_767140 [Sparassis latifolia]|uniref:Large ribosomal subunit protein mL40 n=1 Tax=Sparassis crispa TaxID=139825 RepID=A0A401G5P3_9APHY|nr:54S ribosomal protein L28, mitochondrial [Sparassis crispa]GBE77482.1 54S ribosomal protein L28, mitochondrial [Sparassis crispa]